MNRLKLLALLSMLGFVTPGALPQDYEAEGDPARQEQDIPEAGFWPTPRMMELFIDRITEDMAETYDFDEDQLYQTRELIKERFPRWLNQNRGEIQRLTNQWLEVVMDPQPASFEDMTDFGRRALPLFDEFIDLSLKVTEEMRRFLTRDQQALLEAQRQAFIQGTNLIRRRFEDFAEGHYDPDRHNPESPDFVPPKKEYGQTSEEGELGKRSGPGGNGAASRQPVEPKRSPDLVPGRPPDEWVRYVEAFIRRYQLNQEQQAKAYRALRRRQEMRDGYLSKKGELFSKARRKLNEGKSDRARAAAKQHLEKLTRPLGRMFTQLKEDLEKIPTRKQRAAAAKRSLERGEPARAGGPGGSARKGARPERPGSP